MLLSRHQNSGQNHNIKIGDRSSENVAQIKYLGRTATNQNLIQEEFKRRQKMLSSRLRFKNVNIRILSCVCHGDYKTGFGLVIGFISQSQSHITTDDQSVSAYWFRAPSGAHEWVSEWITIDGQSVSLSWCRAPHDQILITIWLLLFFIRYRAPPPTGGRVCHLSYSPKVLQYS
jgi:hypothetical protein